MTSCFGDFVEATDADNRLVAIGKQLEKNSNDWEAWAAKADVLCSLGLHNAAIRCCERSLALNPRNILTWTTKGLALRKLGRLEEAEVAFSMAKALGYGGP